MTKKKTKKPPRTNRPPGRPADRAGAVKGNRRWQICLHDSDRDALSYLQSVFAHSHKSEALRYIIRRFDAQLRAGKLPEPRTLELAKSKGGHRWLTNLLPEDAERIQYAVDTLGLSHESQAVRLALRVVAMAEGFRPEGGW